VARLDCANARIGARRARLLGAGSLRDLLARPSSEARVELLRALPVGAALPAELGDDPLAAVEAALREGWRRDALGILAAAEGARARALLEAWLRLDEAAAVKAVLRGVAKRVPVDDALAAAPPTPALPEEALRRAAAALTVEEAVAVLAEAGSTLAGPLRRELPLGVEGSVLPLEIAADRAAVEQARRACRRRGEDGALLLRHLQDRVDVRNAETLLALAGAAPAVDAFVAGGRRLPETEFRRLAGSGAAAMRSGLSLLFPGAGAAAPWAAARALERALVVPLRREARSRPLSIAVPLAYLAERRAEVRRVALVLRGAALELPAEEILALVEA
jgi:V/A-type H+-transporting ATPase subunit C